jgi:hypothetical protein
VIKPHSPYHNIPLWQDKTRMKKVIQCMAGGMGHYMMCHKLILDHGTIVKYFRKIKGIPNRKYIDKVVAYIKKHKPTYEQLSDKFGARGLTALFYNVWRVNKIVDSDIAKKIYELRWKYKQSEVQIAKKLGLAPSSVHYHIAKSKRKDIEFCETEWNAVTRKKIVLDMYLNKGLKPWEIVERTKYSYPSVVNIINRAGYKSRRVLTLTLQDIRAIDMLKEKGVSWHKIGNIYGYNECTIYEYYRRNRQKILMEAKGNGKQQQETKSIKSRIKNDSGVVKGRI